jgi:UDP-N-acetylglucosamine acyltransferase
MTDIHKTAIIHKKAILADDVSIGPYTIIGPDVKIKSGTTIKSHCVAEGHTTIGENCEIYSQAVLGTAPQDLKYNNEPTKLIIGDNNIIREFTTVNRGTSASGKTSIGNNNLIMAYAHIAHDCEIKNNTIIANAVNMAGHILVDDFAIVGGLVPIHQFCRIGKHCIVGGLSRINKDVPPYSKVAGSPPKVYSLNYVGLRRRGFNEETINTLKKVYKILFSSNLNTSQALQKIKNEINLIDDVKQLIDFIESSSRGIIK